ncbi:MAG: hypothetical protein LKI39_10565 [Bacteroides sp.]|nr:hypothetical protein [Bacteroides sp.]MCI1682986.1 hypothetical protein [Bacteroides sp.]
MNAIFYKEWIKTRWYYLLAVVTTLGFSGYCMLRINRAIELKGAAHIWGAMLERDAVFIDLLQYVPLIIGILMAVVQFVPEMQRKCLKLTLHLPYPQLKMVATMLLAGLALLLLCFALNLLLMDVYMRTVLASELKNHVLLTSLPWFLAGICGYLMVSWICLEPSWKRRVLNLIVTVLVLRIFFLSATPEAYDKFISGLGIYTLLTASFSWLSVIRFKEGKQD